MCGRYAIAVTAERVAEAFDALWQSTLGPSLPHGDGSVRAPAALPRFNVAPTQLAPVVRRGPTGGRVISLLRWGLVPSWADDPAIGSRMINARSESAAEKPSFRTAWRRRRCLVPASHFYEWKKVASGKQPHAITTASTGSAGSGARDEATTAAHVAAHEPALLALAGLWESWRDEIESFTILTTDANALMRPLHDRMPVILPRERWTQWLDPAWSGPEDDAERRAWMSPAPDALLRSFPVSALVNAPRNEAPACLEPLSAA